ncbi:uncharacterized protein LOC116805786 [Drosophila grimshawi]|uniref:uncharacterized protein LOC116805786 n=1 Tax=Drosophila grimshawi TaxID=7222 RepID=UPI000C86ECAC|nr:uncharacterized protein LOC116805786 [Drosophila grimshawi]
MGCCYSRGKSVDLPAVPPAPAKQRTTTLPEFPGTNAINGSSGNAAFGEGVSNRALEVD